MEESPASTDLNFDVPRSKIIDNTRCVTRNKSSIAFNPGKDPAVFRDYIAGLDFYHSPSALEITEQFAIANDNSRDTMGMIIYSRDSQGYHQHLVPDYTIARMWVASGTTQARYYDVSDIVMVYPGRIRMQDYYSLLQIYHSLYGRYWTGIRGITGPFCTQYIEKEHQIRFGNQIIEKIPDGKQWISWTPIDRVTNPNDWKDHIIVGPNGHNIRNVIWDVEETTEPYHDASPKVTVGISWTGNLSPILRVNGINVMPKIKEPTAVDLTKLERPGNIRGFDITDSTRWVKQGNAEIVSPTNPGQAKLIERWVPMGGGRGRTEYYWVTPDGKWIRSR